MINLISDPPLLPMTAAEAFSYMPQWGSFMHVGDPGAIMYTLDTNGLPPDQRHVQEIIAYIDEVCAPIAYQNPNTDEGQRDIAKLTALQLYLLDLKDLPVEI